MSLTVSCAFVATVLVGSLLCLISGEESDAGPACPAPCECRVEQPGDRFIVDCKRKSLWTFPNMTGLEDTLIHRLYMDGNQISDIFAKQFAGLRIKGIQLSDNPIMLIEEGAFDGLADSLEFLSLRRTHLMDVPTSALKELHNLLVLDMSGVSPLMTLNGNAFQGLSKLETLVLKGVMFIDIHPDAFEGLGALQLLRMESCTLVYIPDAIQRLKTLRFLHLDQNSIDYIPDDMFSTLPELRTLSLSANRFADGEHHVTRNAFNGLNKLEELDLAFNEFTAVPHHAFHPLQSLRVLKLSDNYLTSIHPESFIGLNSLFELDIGGNVVVVDEEILSDIADTLEVLRLGRTGLTWETFPHSVIRNLTKLEELDLEGNHFPHIPSDAFSGVTAKSISLMYCGVENTHPTAFRGLDAPAKIKLNWNKIQNITFVHDPCAFEKIELYRNPLHCDCQLEHMAKYEHLQFVGHCATPLTFQGHELKHYMSDIHESCQSAPVKRDVEVCPWDKERYTKASAASSMHSLYTSVNSLVLLSLVFMLFRN